MINTFIKTFNLKIKTKYNDCFLIIFKKQIMGLVSFSMFKHIRHFLYGNASEFTSHKFMEAVAVMKSQIMTKKEPGARGKLPWLHVSTTPGVDWTHLVCHHNKDWLNYPLFLSYKQCWCSHANTSTRIFVWVFWLRLVKLFQWWFNTTATLKPLSKCVLIWFYIKYHVLNLMMMKWKYKPENSIQTLP